MCNERGQPIPLSLSFSHVPPAVDICGQALRNTDEKSIFSSPTQQDTACSTPLEKRSMLHRIIHIREDQLRVDRQSLIVKSRGDISFDWHGIWIDWKKKIDMKFGVNLNEIRL